MLFFREIINNITPSTFSFSVIKQYLFYYVIMAEVIFILCVTQVGFVSISAKRQARRIRSLFFKAINRQDVAWHDENAAGSLLSKLTDNIFNIEQGMGTKLGEFVQHMSGFLGGIVIAYYVNYKLALVATAMLPLVVAGFGSFGILGKTFMKREMEAYSKASAIAGEVLSSIRTVMAFGGEKREVKRYMAELSSVESVGIKKALAFGGASGLIASSIYLSAALVFWYGVTLMLDGLDPGAVVTVFSCIILGSIFMGSAFMTFPNIIHALAAAQDVYGTIERIPEIDKDRGGVRLPNFTGNITFRNVDFAYPTRPEVTVLKNFSLQLKSGQTIALVGPSGSGKSTVVQLIQRFYDPAAGKVLIEDVELPLLDLKHFRSMIGCVQQEPVLFDGTIFDNIRMGKLDATPEEIIEAAKLANAHDFICTLPEGYETRVGEAGGGLSGGQKQRIAIARAIVRQPRLLLLDEATSSLDTRSERVVQEALERAASGRTVLIVAHRLTTVRHADLIMVLSEGEIREVGTHKQLMKANGLYAAMVQSQAGDKVEEGTNGPNIPDGLGYTELSSHRVQDSQAKRRASIVEEDDWSNNPTLRLIKMNRPEAVFLTLGFVFSILSSLTFPVFAILYSEVYDIITKPSEESSMKARIAVISASMAGVGLAQLLIGIGQGYFFGVAGERLIKRIRGLLFESILQQEVAWFDSREHQPGYLTALLATEATKVSKFTGTRLSSVLEAILIIAISLAVALYYNWQVTLVMLSFFPMLALGNALQTKMFGQAKDTFQDSKAIQIAQEAIKGNRTVTSFALEDFYNNRFIGSSRSYLRQQSNQAMIQAILCAFSLTIPTFSICATFGLGAYLIDQKKTDVVSLFRAFLVINFASQAIGRLGFTATDAKQVTEAVEKVLRIVDRVPRIILNAGDIPLSPFKGRVRFQRLHFRYPTRPEVKILTSFSHDIEQGKKVALVGQSGCGKSTLLQLVQRFYEPDDHGPNSGIFFDGMNIRDLAPCWIRQQIAIVSQEPTLFNMSIRENIAYGDNTRIVSMDEIIEAARTANIHEFIMSLPEGYETLAGEGGSQLSGGQKQRIAIARALIRRPVLLLLDEATSALDTENERLVQEALDAAMQNRTSIVVAHRLTTVENTDEIVVIENGRKIECGSPDELLAAKGAFHALHHAEAR
ncbi:ATP-dependent translocase ABCB1, variant 2 [Clonorchis sinensis]|uniref:ATP-dependent translocase ABCB1, variant 2 n=1 Tax=Clonorchis sinensis TaxID=79923 RepID=A0A8T1MTZ7_CLOSI|nr:ATP-dependent translocase ABCB1, variant 2 [Clonorchis sinensis]